MNTHQQSATANPNTTDAEPAPRIMRDERYEPRVCAGPDCSIPPHVRWRVTTGGTLYGLYRRTGQTIDLCDSHEREVVDLTGADWGDKPTPPRLPKQRPENGP